MIKKYIAIVDYGMGNLGSVEKMISKIGGFSVLTKDPLIIKNATKIILPGVGSFDNAIFKLKSLGLFELIKECVIIERKPILGICLGMQLLGTSSREGNQRGFGFFDYVSYGFNEIKSTHKLTVPNMGWKDVEIYKNCNITKNLQTDLRYYFVHSFFVPFNENYTIMTSNYGTKYSAAVKKDHIYGMQFHPEKSHKYGMQLLKNFIEEFLYD